MAFNLTMKSATAEASVTLAGDGLRSFLSAARNVVPKRTALPVLKYVRIVSHGGEGCLRVTDTDCYVEHTFKSAGTGDIDLSIDYAMFQELVTKAPSGCMLVERTGDKLTFRVNCVTCGTLGGVDGKNFPTLLIPPNTEKGSVVMSNFDIRYVYKNLSPLCTDDKDYPGLTGIYLEFCGDKHSFVATDRYMLVCVGSTDTGTHIVIPPVAFKAACDSSENFVLHVYGQYYRFIGTSVTIYGNGITGAYPDYHKLFCTEYRHSCKIDVGALRTELGRLMAVIPTTKKGLKPVMLTYGDGCIGVARVPQDYTFTDYKGIKMNAIKVFELLARFEDNATVTFSASYEQSRPTLWTDSRGTSMLPPLT